MESEQQGKISTRITNSKLFASVQHSTTFDPPMPSHNNVKRPLTCESVTSHRCSLILPLVLHIERRLEHS